MTKKNPKTEQGASLTRVFCRLRLQDRNGDSNLIRSPTGLSHFNASVMSVVLVFIYEICQNEHNSCKSAEIPPRFLEKLKLLTSWKGSCRTWNISVGINIKMLFYIMPTVSCSNMNICTYELWAFSRSFCPKRLTVIHTFTHRWRWLPCKVPTSTSGAIWGSVSPLRTLWHADQGNQTSNPPITRLHSRPTHAYESFTQKQVIIYSSP